MTNQKGSATLILLVVLIVVVAGGLVYFAFLKNPGEVAVSPTPTPIATKTVNPTANWKIYTNTSVGYSMRYPSNLGFVNYCGGEGDSATVPETTCGEAFLDELNTNRPEKQLYVRVVDNKEGLLMKTFAQSSLKASEIVEGISEQKYSGKAGATAVFTGTLNFSADPKDASGRFYSSKIKVIFVSLADKKVLEITYPSTNEIYKQVIETLIIR